MTNLIREIRELNGLGETEIAEAFAGGAGASLSLLYGADTDQIHLNDADQGMFSFWWSLVKRPAAFLKKLDDTPVSIDEWKNQRAIYLDNKNPRLDRGFATFYLNRTNRSGIIMNGGPIGGYSQYGDWKLNVRFNKSDLARRCKKVGEYKNRISISGLDGIDFLNGLDLEKVTLFIDPPYFAKGKLLYLNLLTADYHKRLADVLKSFKRAAWIVTYDDCPEIRKLYEQWAEINPFLLSYSAAEKRKGKEILITPRWMTLPAQVTDGDLSNISQMSA